MALKKIKSSLERMFDKNLHDLVHGIRYNKEMKMEYIATCMKDIEKELQQDNLSVKGNAISKLTYLQMLGYDISWAGFNIIEVMSSNKFMLKRIGYLAASQSFNCDSELLMLTTNMMRKALCSQNEYEVGLALTSLSCYISTDLARNLSNDILKLLSSTNPYIRKRAVLMMFRVFLKYPEALRLAFPKLKEKLEDPDPGVQSAAVNVICELAAKNPKNYVNLAPVFFKLMATSNNNFMLVKIIKLLGVLIPLEPRLGNKLMEPLTNLINSTSAVSILYECTNTLISVLISISLETFNRDASIQLCVQKLLLLMKNSDKNLKYLSLLSMTKILKIHPKCVLAHKDLIFQCMEDKDELIHLTALDLLYGMVSKKNLMEIVKKLTLYMDKAVKTKYRDELLGKILLICSQNNYQFITNFEWYITILVELAQLKFGSKQGHIICSQLIDVCVRVQAIRPFAIAEMSQLLDAYVSTNQFSIMQEVLCAAAWLCGEYARELKKPEDTLKLMIKYKTLPPHIEAMFIHNIFKLFANIIEKLEVDEEYDMIISLCDLITTKLEKSVKSCDLEVQERSSTMLIILQILKEAFQEKQQNRVARLIDYDILNEPPGDQTNNISSELKLLFSGELNPVAPKAQKGVPIPEGLDLNVWINKPLQDSEQSKFIKIDESDVPVTDVDVNVHLKQRKKKLKKEKKEKANSSVAYEDRTVYQNLADSETSRRNYNDLHQALDIDIDLF